MLDTMKKWDIPDKFELSTTRGWHCFAFGPLFVSSSPGTSNSMHYPEFDLHQARILERL